MAKKTNVKKILPDVISIMKSIDVTDGTFENCELIFKGIRTMQAQEGGKKEGNKNAKEDSVIALTMAEYYKALGDEVKVNFGMRITPLNMDDKLVQTNSVDFYHKFNEVCDEAVQSENLRKNAEFIAYNILNGRWLWRNRDVAEDIKIEIFKGETKDKPFISYESVLDSTRDIVIDKESNVIDYEKTGMDKNAVEKLAEVILKGLTEEPVNLRIRATLKVIENQNLYPSQTFNPVKEEIGESPVSRRFYKIINKNGEKIPAISADKLWNAIRTYDVWFKKYEELKEPISIELLGGSVKFQNFFREPDEFFSTILAKKITKEEISENEEIYLIGCLIRGGAITKTNNNKNDKKDS